MRIKLNVNNVAATVDVLPDMPLLWVLRDVMNLKGSKFGCGMDFAALALYWSAAMRCAPA